MPLRWQSKLRLMHPGPANGRLPARSGRSDYKDECPLRTDPASNCRSRNVNDGREWLLAGVTLPLG